jgi:ATP-binding cassette subfamily F protein uup
MPILTLDNACLAFGHVALLDHAALQLDDGERVALIGRNGSGKSSLLRALAGLGPLDDGAVWRKPDLRIAYVPQEPDFPPGLTVYEAVASGLGEMSRLLVDYHDTAQRLAHDGSEALLEHLHDLQMRLENGDGWRLGTRVEQVLSQLGLSGEARLGELSGGGIKRVALGQALAGDPELLLLDEPTNHLDLDGILWLEQLITGFGGAVMVITHDRRFLDAVATRVIELDRGRLASFPGSFSAYQKRKADMLEAEAQQSAKFDKLLAQEEVWIRKGIEARRTRNEGRVRRLEQLRRERAARRERAGGVNFALARGDVSGKLVAEIENVSKRYGDKDAVKDFSCRIVRGDKIGLIGPNGAGKTTLIKLILGEIQPDAGTVRLGSKLAVAYFDQFRAVLDEEAALTDVISPGGDYVQIGGEKKHVISYLEDFLFPAARSRSPVKSLSGGERNRLLLARLFSRPANVIVLDEPTNDLDIETLELLESLLQDYDGTVFLVSHDRSFLDNIVTQVIAAEGGGVWREYVGGFEDWQRVRMEQAARAASPAPERRDSREARPRAKLSFKEVRELEALPDRIAALEAEQAGVTERLADPAIHRDDPEQVRELKERLASLEAEIGRVMQRWEELESRSAGVA